MTLTRSFALLAVLSAGAFAEAPKAKSVAKQGEWDVVTLESGTVAKVLVPAEGAKTKGLVMAFHGNYTEPDDILRFGAPIAAHRDEVWCALQATGSEQGARAWDLEADVPRIPELLDYVLATYPVEKTRVLAFGFSMGGAAACRAYGNSRARFAGLVTCAATEAPGERGDACAGGRGVFIIGTRDGNYVALPQWRKAIGKCGDGFATWVVTELDHELPDAVYANDAFNHCLDAASKGGEKTLPRKPDHPLAVPAGAAPPEFFHAFFALKPAGGPARTKLAAKSTAEKWLAQVKKGEKTMAEAAAAGDDEADRAAGGSADPAGLEKLGEKVKAAAKGLAPGAGVVVETADGSHIVWRIGKK
ncbi:MAG: peptidylprolyl isomerase [Planctomycetes bacterium]|nr:peptidylprolyl isomerase [Planctomycetota bacterium]